LYRTSKLHLVISSFEAILLLPCVGLSSMLIDKGVLCSRGI